MKNPAYADKIVLRNGGVIETEAGTAIVSVSQAGTATLTGTETIVASEIALATDSVLKGVGGVATAMAPLAALVESTTATATADGLTTGALTALTGLKKFVAVTSAAATNAITLPGINVGTIGQEIFLTVGANGYELLTVAGSNVTINQVDSDGTNQLDVAANTTLRCTQISGTAWLAEQIAATAITVVAPDND